MGDEQRGPVGHNLAERVVYALFDIGVDGTGGVVEDKDARVVQQRPRQGDPLALPTRKSEAPFADEGVVTVGEGFDELVGLSRFGGRLDFLGRRVAAPVGDIGTHAVREKKALFKNNADLAAQRSQRHGPDIVTVDQHGARGGIVKARYQHGHGGLAASARPHQGHFFPRRYMEVELLQDRQAVAVGETDVGEVKLSSQPRQFDGSRRVGNARLQVEQLKNALDAGPSLLANGEDTGQLAGRGHELGDVRRKGEECPQRDLALNSQPAPKSQDADLPDSGDGLEQRLVAGLEPDTSHLGAVQRLGRRDHPPELGPLLPEGLHHPDAVDVLVDDLGDVALTLLGVPGGRENFPTHAVGNDEQGRRHDHADYGQQR